MGANPSKSMAFIRIPLLSFFLAVLAIAKNLDGEFVGLEPALFPNPFQDGLDLFIGKLFDSAAGKADQVTVSCLGNLRLIMTVAFSKIYYAHQSCFYQEVQSPVNGSQRNLLPLPFQSAMDFIGVGMNGLFRKYLLENQTSCPGEFEVLGLQVILECFEFHFYFLIRR
jgi:hypothetical protein